MKMRKLATLLLTAALLFCAIPVMTMPAMSATVGLQGFQGTILNVTGVPMSGVMVTARNTTTNAPLTAMTNSQGVYELTTPAGNYNVSATFFNYNANTSYTDIDIPTGGSAELNFTMFEILGSIHGFVTDGLVPVVGVTVFMANDQRNYTTTTVAPLGEYRINNVQPGVYVVTFDKKGYERTNSLPLNILRGISSQQNASMQAQPCTLFGRVTENGKPLEGVMITAQGSDSVKTGITDGDGNYTIKLTSDSYTITFTKKNYDAKEMSISLDPFEVRHLDISLLKSKSNNTNTFLFGFDLPHSLMVIGLMLALLTICIALFINFKVRKKPELLGKDPQGEQKE